MSELYETYEKANLISQDVQALRALEKHFGIPIPQIDQISWIDYRIDKDTHQVEQFRQHYFGFMAKDHRVVALGLSLESVNEKNLQVPTQMPILSQFTALTTLDVHGWKKVFETFLNEYNRRQQEYQKSMNTMYRTTEERREAQGKAQRQLNEPIAAISQLELIRQLKKIPTLHNLDMSDCHFDSIQGLEDLSALEDLDLSKNNVKKLENVNFHNLKHLTLSENPIDTFPTGLENCPELRSLLIDNTKIKELPEYVGNLSNLEILKLPLQIRDFPQTFIHLKQLKTLVTDDFPEYLGELISLETLLINAGKMEQISPAITKLTNLQSLTINNCRFLQHLPEKLGTLQELRSLKVTNCGSLETIPDSLFDLKKLTTLNLYNNDLRSFADRLGDLPRLEILTLSNNQLKYLPYSVFKLSNLIDFSIENNPLDLNDKLISAKTLPEIKAYSKKKMAINVFISHAVVDFEPCHLEELSNYLQNQLEVNIAFICERDLSGNIDGFMDRNVPRSHLILFIATPTSVKSVDCGYELKLSREYNVQIVPIKAKELDWGNLATIGLNRELGMEVDFHNPDEFEKFKGDLYDYIKQLKRQIDLHDKEQGKIDRLTIGLKALERKVEDLASKVERLANPAQN